MMPQYVQRLGDSSSAPVTACPAVVTQPRLKSLPDVSWVSVLDSQLRNGHYHRTCSSEYSRHLVHFVDMQSISLLDLEGADNVALGTIVVAELSLSAGSPVASNLEVDTEPVVKTY